VSFSGRTHNASERALRAVAVCRKNYLFARSDSGGRSAAVLYTLVGTCRRLGIDPLGYLRDVFARLPACPAGRVDDLLPAGRLGDLRPEGERDVGRLRPR
jgi:transposase